MLELTPQEVEQTPTNFPVFKHRFVFLSFDNKFSFVDPIYCFVLPILAILQLFIV